MIHIIIVLCTYVHEIQYIIRTSKIGPKIGLTAAFDMRISSLPNLLIVYIKEYYIYRIAPNFRGIKLSLFA